ncbi:MAG: ABC transporter substrate-binding protein [Gemmatimonadales bacterium]
MRRLAAALPLLLAVCQGADSCERCGTVVIAATGEPRTLLPPLVAETVGRDVSDLIYEKLLELVPGGSPVDSAAYRPALAARWMRAEPATWRFVLRGGATWQDGRPVTPDDVVFSYAAWVDTTLGSPASELAGRATVSAEGDSAVLIRFDREAPENLYDATFRVRVLPKHVWDRIPRAEWAADTSIARLVGSGPFRLTGWIKGQTLTLERAAPVEAGAIERLVWQFAGDQDAAVNFLLADEADVIETILAPGARERAMADSSLAQLPYPSAVYGFVGFSHRGPDGRAHPVLGDRAVRRALTLGLDRKALVDRVVGGGAVVPPGPISRALWIWSDEVATLGYDTTRARAELTAAGWVPGGDGIRRLGGRRLAIDILIPSTSSVRRGLAEGMQEMWRRLGVDASVTGVDFPVFQQRLTAGRFDAMVGAWLDEPSPRSLADQWTRAGWGVLNYGRYFHPGFDSLFALASSTTEPARARRLWTEALDTLNADAAGIFLYNPTNVAFVSTRLENVTIDPFSWMASIPSWRASR